MIRLVEIRFPDKRFPLTATLPTALAKFDRKVGVPVTTRELTFPFSILAVIKFAETILPTLRFAVVTLRVVTFATTILERIKLDDRMLALESTFR